MGRISPDSPFKLKSKASGIGRGLRVAALLAAFLAVSLLVGRAQSTNSAGRLDFDAFKIIAQKNIFDSNRSSRSGRRGDAPKAAQVESFALTGTLSYEKGIYAFFDGSDSSYRKALQIGDSIAGNKITAISADHVKLEANGRETELSVGMQMKRQDEGEWQVAERAETFAAAAPASATKDKPESSSGGEDSDVLKKLLQKREQELK